MSGGPTVDDAGRVVGLNSTRPGSADAFDVVAPTSTLRTMLDRRGVRAEPGPVDVAFRAGLDHRATGENADAVAAFRETVRLRADHGRARDQLALAEQAYARDGDASERRALLWGVVGGSTLLVLLVGGVVTTIVVRWRRRVVPGAAPATWPAPLPASPYGPHVGFPHGPVDPPTGPIPVARLPHDPFPTRRATPVDEPPSRTDTVC
ncbi:tetratricopeptide repeat protein [Actinomycetospora sp. CA-053990]|uniref:tetratricopeptide repeat protein n=1 Tax=Actinomycetospora sp. CA-053990 TaxID=3239891 RepID=UPI003D923C0F